MQFRDAFFEEMGRSAGVERLTKAAADKVANEARAGAPVDSGDYVAGIEVVKRESKNRTVFLVKGTDWKTMLVESKTGNLVRALRKAGRG